MFHPRSTDPVDPQALAKNITLDTDILAGHVNLALPGTLFDWRDNGDFEWAISPVDGTLHPDHFANAKIPGSGGIENLKAALATLERAFARECQGQDHEHVTAAARTTTKELLGSAADMTF